MNLLADITGGLFWGSVVCGITFLILGDGMIRIALWRMANAVAVALLMLLGVLVAFAVAVPSCAKFLLMVARQ